MVASVASSRSTASVVPIQPKSRAVADRQQIQAEIGRRGAVRHDRRRVFLEIVRRQHVVGRRHEGLEEPPGAPRDQPQRLGVGGRHRHRGRRSAATG